MELKNVGHTASFWNIQPQARARLLNTFFDSGVVDDSLYKEQVVNFDANKTWGDMAKVTLAIFLAVCALFIGLILFIWKKVTKRRTLVI